VSDGMRILTDRTGDYPYLWEWLSTRTGLPWATDMRTLGLARADGTVVAVVAASTFLNGRQCFIHVAADAPLTRRFLRAIFKYLFVDSKIRSVLSLSGAEDKYVHEFAERLGFKLRARLHDTVLYEMTPDHCKWISHGQKEQAAAGT
jgi:hypothetical protein